MDNITHSLIGIAAGETLSLQTKKARAPLWIASILASNLPDIDVIFSPLLSQGKLGSLLQHRGHTHTLLGGSFLVLLVFLLFRWWKRNEDLPWREIAIASAVGFVLHIFADSWNSYGVHPFWPVYNGWFYGDILFILEPWIWALFLPWIFYGLKNRWGRGLCLLLLALMLTLAWTNKMVPTAIALALSLGVPTFFGFYYLLSPRFRVYFSWAFLMCVLGVFSTTHRHLANANQEPGTHLLLQPYPGNPLCWTMIKARMNESTYRAEIYLLSSASYFPVKNCRPWQSLENMTAPMQPLPFEATKQIQPIGFFEAPRSDWNELQENCNSRTYFQWARIPYWKKEGNGWIVGDLRFDRKRDMDFSEMRVGEKGSEPCPHGMPPWVGVFQENR